LHQCEVGLVCSPCFIGVFHLRFQQDSSSSDDVFPELRIGLKGFQTPVERRTRLQHVETDLCFVGASFGGLDRLSGGSAQQQLVFGVAGYESLAGAGVGALHQLFG
jgi:hypothetical protein